MWQPLLQRPSWVCLPPLPTPPAPQAPGSRSPAAHAPLELRGVEALTRCQTPFAVPRGGKAGRGQRRAGKSVSAPLRAQGIFMGCRREGRAEAGARLPGGRDAPPTRVLCRLPRGIGACGRRPEPPTSGPVRSQFGGDRSLEGESRKRFPSTWGVAGGGRKEPGEEAGVEPPRGAARQPAAYMPLPSEPPEARPTSRAEN